MTGKAECLHFYNLPRNPWNPKEPAYATCMKRGHNRELCEGKCEDFELPVAKRLLIVKERLEARRGRRA